MPKICIALTVPSEYIQFQSLKGWQKTNGDALKAAFASHYEITFDYATAANEQLDLVVVPEPEPAGHLPQEATDVPVLAIPLTLFLRKEYDAIVDQVETYFMHIKEKNK